MTVARAVRVALGAVLLSGCVTVRPTCPVAPPSIWTWSRVDQLPSFDHIDHNMTVDPMPVGPSVYFDGCNTCTYDRINLNTLAGSCTLLACGSLQPGTER